MNFLTILITAVGLAMDAFAVAIADGMQVEHKLTVRPVLRVALFLGAFQGLMALLGFLLGTTFRDYIQALDHWIAFTLLALIGANLMREGLRAPEDCAVNDSLTNTRTLTLQAIATSIDALAVGVSYSLIANLSLGLMVGTIAGVALLFAAVGVFIGYKLGCVMQRSAELIGGLVLIGIAIKILAEHISAGI